MPHREQEDTSLSMPKLLADMLLTQERLIRLQREWQQKEDEEHISLEAPQLTVFENDTFVLVQRHTELPTRLHTKWLGPMRVISHQGAEYVLLDLITGKEKRFHITGLKEFKFDPLQTVPTDVARRDYLEFFIEKIIEHRGNSKQPSSMEFLVKWLSYDNSYNTWEPWAGLRKAAPLHDYLRLQNLTKIIPREFRNVI